MECKRVRDRFSSLLENELDPLEEKIVREHLAFCSECQEDLQQFTKTMQWVHSVKEVEVPDGFLSEIYKKMEEGKRKAPLIEETRWQWFRHPFPLKLPVQAVAMVAIVFLVLYLTKMMPVETSRVKEAEHKKPSISAPLPSEKQMGQLPAQIKTEKDRVVAQTPLKPSPPSNVTAAPSETAAMEPALAKGEQASLAAKPPQEILLRISDREKTLNQLYELLQQFGGKIITTEGNIFLASLPKATFSEFEKELLGLGSPEKTDKMMVKKNGMERLDVPEGAKRRALEMKGKASAAPETERQDYLLVRILLVEE
jgi:predicted anti-sigma-YlaC factor YlaD